MIGIKKYVKQSLIVKKKIVQQVLLHDQ